MSPSFAGTMTGRTDRVPTAWTSFPSTPTAVVDDRMPGRGSRRGFLPHPTFARGRDRSPERHPRGHQRRGQQDRRTPADDARGVHHQAPQGLRLTTKEKNMGKLEGKIAPSSPFTNMR